MLGLSFAEVHELFCTSCIISLNCHIAKVDQSSCCVANILGVLNND